MIRCKYFLHVTSAVAVLLVTFNNVFAQYECRSRLSGNLSPLKEGSNVYVGGELVSSGGMVYGSPIANSMFFAASEYTLNQHQLYAEGGVKYWYKQDEKLDAKFSQYRFGLRAISYTYFKNNTTIKAGLQQFKSSDNFLVNERAVGFYMNTTIKNSQLAISLASPTKDFSRNGHFCANAFLYDIVPTRNLELGNNLLETNFFLATLKVPTTKKSESSNTDSDGFGDFNDFEETESSNAKFEVKNVGGLIYSEFGSFISNPIIHAGIIMELKVKEFTSIHFQTQYQENTDSRTMLAFIRAEHQKNWKNNTTSTAEIQYLTTYGFNTSAATLPRFSNLFYGEVFRMDAIDMPLINVNIKHRWLEKHSNIKLMYTHQLSNEKMKEADLSASKLFFNKKLKLTLLAGVLSSEELNEWVGIGKLELRFFI